MKRLMGGYTLIEVMLFLAISSLILFIAILEMSGQTAETEFRTSVDAVNSKIHQWIDQVQNGESSNPSTLANANLNCSTTVKNSKTYPQLLSSGTNVERGANPDCIFMGNAILVTNNDTNSNHIYDIPIVGLRTNPSTGDLSDSIEAANPIAALNDSSVGGFSSIDLSSDYTIPNGTKVLYAVNSLAPNDVTNCTGPGNLNSCSFMAGFFTSLNSNAATTGNGAQTLQTVLYPKFNTSVSDLSSASNIQAVSECIRLQSSTCDPTLNSAPSANLWGLGDWLICLGSVRDDEWAALHVESSTGVGYSTNVNYGRGGTPCQ